VDAWARDRTTELLPELQAFTMRVDGVAAKLKLSQNRTRRTGSAFSMRWPPPRATTTTPSAT
jgi:5'-3' exonuclease